MATAATTRLSVEDIKPGIGSRILNSKEELLRGENAAELRDLLEQRGVLVFPQVNFTDEEQVAFTKTLGTFAPELTDKGGEDKVHFAYCVEADKPGKPYSYRVQGPTFVVEFLNVQADSAKNPANHIHSAWRRLPVDFGLTAAN